MLTFVAGMAIGFFLGIFTPFVIYAALSGESADELSNQGADEGGRAFFQHDVERN